MAKLAGGGGVAKNFSNHPGLTHRDTIAPTMKPRTAAAPSAIIAGDGEVNRPGTKIAMNTSAATAPRGDRREYSRPIASGGSDASHKVSVSYFP
jgi:hypothetical protein